MKGGRACTSGPCNNRGPKATSLAPIVLKPCPPYYSEAWPYCFEASLWQRHVDMPRRPAPAAPRPPMHTPTVSLCSLLLSPSVVLLEVEPRGRALLLERDGDTVAPDPEAGVLNLIMQLGERQHLATWPPRGIHHQQRERRRAPVLPHFQHHRTAWRDRGGRSAWLEKRQTARGGREQGDVVRQGREGHRLTSLTSSSLKFVSARVT